MAAEGYEIDPDKMREAIKLAESMLEELDSRANDVPELLRLAPPSTSEDTVTNQYFGGQRVGARTTAVAANQAYSEAFQAQFSYLQQLIPQLQGALSSYEAAEQEIGDSMNSSERQV